MAWRSRGMIWVEIGSTVRPIFSATWRSTAGSILAKVPTAPEMAQVAISLRAATSRARPRVEGGVVAGELQAEGGGLGMDAVAAADGERVLVLEGAALQRGEQPVEIGQQDVARLLQLHGEAGVEHVRRGHALMQEAGLGPDMLGEIGQEGDDVVLGLALDLVDARDVELAAASRPPRRPPWESRPAPPGRRQAWASISNQMRKRFSGSQIAAISGRL